MKKITLLSSRKVFFTLLILTLTLLSSYNMTCQTNSAKMAFAIPLSDITIDGKLDDWPENMEVYSVEWVSRAYPRPTTPLEGPEDFTANFRVGYNLEENILYVAILVVDDEVVVHPDDPKMINQDACRIFIDADHSGGDTEIQGRQLYDMVPGPGKRTPKGDGNPALDKGDTKVSGVQGAFSTFEQTIVYEWAIPLFESFPDKGFQIEAGKTIGFALMVSDADGQDNANFVFWTPIQSEIKNSDLFGDLMLLDSYAKMGMIRGSLLSKKEMVAASEIAIDAYQDGKKVKSVKTNADGQYQFRLEPGEYKLKLSPGQVLKSPEELALSVSAGQEIKADFTLSEIQLPEILVQSMALYQSLKSYKDTTSVETRMMGGGMDNKMTSPSMFLFERPNRFWNESIGNSRMGSGIDLICNGEKIVSYMGRWKQYREEEVQEELTAVNLQMLESFVAKNFIMNKDPLRDMKKNTETVKEVGTEKLDGVSTVTIELMQSLSSLGAGMFPGDMLKGMLVPVKLWIGSEDKLIRKIAYEMDMAELLKSMPEEQKARMGDYFKEMKFSITELHTGIAVDPVLSDKDFTFIPPEGAKLVDNFSPPGRTETQESKMTGKPAPDFVLKDLEGKEATLADFEGKVVLLDFWATWCGPCKKAMPHIQTLADIYKENDVVILGINSWEREKDKVEPLLKDLEITYRILLDSDNEVITKYGVRGIPTFFIIDKKGVIRYSYAGLPKENHIIQQNMEELLGE